MRRIALVLIAACAGAPTPLSTTSDAVSVVAGDTWVATNLVPSPVPCKGADGAALGVVDGELVVAMPCEQSGTLHLPAVDGTGSSAAIAEDLQGAEHAEIGDVDLDGNADVAVFRDAGRDVIVLFLGPQPARVTLPAPVQRYMQGAIADVYAGGFPEIVAGGRNANGSTNAAIGVLRVVANGNARNPADWVWEEVRLIGWTMSLEVLDFYGDGTADDLFYTNRSGTNRGAYVIERVAGTSPTWAPHLIATIAGDVSFGDTADTDADGAIDLVVAGNKSTIKVYTLVNGSWTASANFYPTGAGEAHGLTLCDLGDGLQIVATFALADPGESWVAIGELDGSAWYDVAGAAVVTRKPDVASCYGGSIIIGEGDGHQPQNDEGGERWDRAP